MKAAFDGQDYFLMLKREIQELQQLRQGKKLRTHLTRHGEDLGKIVTLEFADNDAIDGIELKYFPEGQGWDAIERVQVKVNERAYDHIIQRRKFGTRYNGSDKIEIFDGDPRNINFI